MASSRWLAPTFCFHQGTLRSGLVVSIGEDGTLLELRPVAALPPDAGVELLGGMALFPGFVNGHSHAFQRLLRGRTEFAHPGHTEDFWSWREAMYRVVAQLGPDDLELATEWAYVEMLLAGFTHVGEFHYLHRDPQGHPYADPNELGWRVVAAAGAAGIGLTLLRTAYERGGPKMPVGPAQRRFAEEPEEFARAMTALAARGGDWQGGVGLAVHSVRAVGRPGLRSARELADTLGVVVHGHVAEQPGEVEACRAEHGLHPIELLDELGLLSPRFTAVHATWLDDGAARRIGRSGATACICPTTERNLGDGLPDLARLRAAGAAWSIGTDSHVRIDPFAELRGLEDGERLRARRRNVLADPEGRLVPGLFEAGTAGGAASLGLVAGVLEAGRRADLVAIDVSGPAFEGLEDDPEALLASLWLTGGARDVRRVWVGGRRVVQDGIHPRQEALRARWGALVRRMR